MSLLLTMRNGFIISLCDDIVKHIRQVFKVAHGQLVAHNKPVQVMIMDYQYRLNIDLNMPNLICQREYFLQDFLEDEFLWWNVLTRRDRVTHIYVRKLSRLVQTSYRHYGTKWCQMNIWPMERLITNWASGNKFQCHLINMQHVSYQRINLILSSTICRLFCLSFNVLKQSLEGDFSFAHCSVGLPSPWAILNSAKQWNPTHTNMHTQAKYFIMLVRMRGG